MKIIIKDEKTLKTLKIYNTTQYKMFRFSEDGFYFNEKRIEELEFYILKDIHVLDLSMTFYLEFIGGIYK